MNPSILTRTLELMADPRFYSDSCQVRDFLLHHKKRAPKNETRHVFREAYSHARWEADPQNEFAINPYGYSL